MSALALYLPWLCGAQDRRSCLLNSPLNMQIVPPYLDSTSILRQRLIFSRQTYPNLSIPSTQSSSQMGCCESREFSEKDAAPVPSREQSTVSNSRQRRVKQEVCPVCSDSHTPDTTIPTSSPDYVKCKSCRGKK
jgi:hypothetical protein